MQERHHIDGNEAYVGAWNTDRIGVIDRDGSNRRASVVVAHSRMRRSFRHPLISVSRPFIKRFLLRQRY